jgi:6-phosphogluconolactonase
MASLAPDVRVFTDAESLSQAAATLFTETARDTINERGRCLVCLSGGKTPLRTYAILAQRPLRDLVDWRQLHFYWGDERCVPPEDIKSNYHAAHEMLLGKVPVLPEQLHRVRTELEPELAAQDYAFSLGRASELPLPWPRFDIVLLGLGVDGHTASIFPGSNIDPGLTAVAVHAENADPPGWRVSLTPEVFNSARRIVFIVQGMDKAAIVASILYGAFDPERLPAQRIRPPNGELIWLLDTGAAGG